MRQPLYTLAKLLSAASKKLTPNNNLVRVVDFAKCSKDSSFGKKEQEHFNQMKDQLEKIIHDLSIQIKETTAKLNNPFVLASLPPDDEKALKNKGQTLSLELQRIQQQSYHRLQQAHMKIIALMSEKIRQASHTLSKEKKYPLIMNHEQVFHYTPDLDVTSEIISELNKMFDAENALKNTQKTEFLNT